MRAFRKKKLSIEMISLPKVRHNSAYTHDQSKQQKEKSPPKYSNSQSRVLKKHRKTVSNASKVQENIQRQRVAFLDLGNINKSKLDETFYKFDNSKRFLEKKNRLQKKKIFNMEKQDFTTKVKLSQEQDLYTGPVIVLQYKIQMSFLSHFCYDSSFAMKRTAATLSWNHQKMYLFGGCPDSYSSALVFHTYDSTSNQWNRVKSKGQRPSLSLMYHTASSYKNYLIFCGGVSIDKMAVKNMGNSVIFIFNVETRCWHHYNWRTYIKNHSSVLANNIMIVSGGINQREKTSNKISFFNINVNNPQFSRVATFSTNLYLSHHKIIQTYSEENRLRCKFAVDGTILFGGKNSNQRLSNELYVLDPNMNRIMDEDQNQILKWQKVKVKGPKPEPRMCHSFDMLPGKGLCVLVGGIGQDNQYLDDLWILDLFGLNWIRVEDVPLLKKTGGMAYHATAIKDSQIYIYGGITKNQTKKQFYLIETQKYKKNNSRHQTRKVQHSTSNLISFKAFQ